MDLPCLTCGSCAQCVDGILQNALPLTVSTWNREKKVMALSRGNFLFHQGEVCRGLYVILSGFIKVYRTGPAGDLQVVRLAGYGGVLGHRALVAQEPLAATAEVVEDAIFCLVSASTVMATLAEDHAVARNLMRILARSLGQSEGRLLAVARMSTPARVASFLLEHADRRTWVFPLRLTREEIGQVVGATTESVSRALRAFERDGTIRLAGRSIQVADVPALSAAATQAP
ncbi:MAG: Crp/Fnr family transcriptional regulator [Armatimonadetes bacterium]|nr:Crp/Fnr family transcriptional regulator [Armatimonadota bacterium]